MDTGLRRTNRSKIGHAQRIFLRYSTGDNVGLSFIVTHDAPHFFHESLLEPNSYIGADEVGGRVRDGE